MKNRILSFCFSVLLLLGNCVPVAAATTTATGNAYKGSTIDETTVVEDLVEGGYNLFDYEKNEDAEEASVITFLEYGYQKDQGWDFGLYLYIYNPLGEQIRDAYLFNSITLASSFDASGNATEYTSFRLYEIDSYENVLYKYRVGQGADASTLYGIAKASGRRYKISGITLTFTEGTHMLDVAATYAYTGYGQGRDESTKDASTLACTVDGIQTISLDLHPASYTWDADVNTQGSLYSVYFSAQDAIPQKYGYLSSYKATGLRAEMSPVVVVDNEEAYNFMKPYVGVAPENLPYEGLSFSYIHPSVEHDYPLALELCWNVPRHLGIIRLDLVTLTWLFYQADLNDPLLADQFEDYADFYGKGSGYLDGSVYSKDLFTSLEEMNFSFTDKDKFEDKTYWGIAALGKWLNELRGNTEDWGDIDAEAITSVKYSDIMFLSEEEVSRKYYVSPSKVRDFIRYVKAETDGRDRTVYLLRFAMEESSYRNLRFSNTDLDVEGYIIEDPVAYLNFRVIQLGFGEFGEEKILPVACDPVDVYTDQEKPPDNFFDTEAIIDGNEDFAAVFQKLFAVFALVALVCGAFFVVSIIFPRRQQVVIRTDSGASESEKKKPRRQKKKK